MAATPTTRARRSKPSPGRPGCWPRTKRITVFGTVHAPIFNPVVAAKEMVTADHIGEGRFGLNIVVGWNEGEFDMFGVEQRAARGPLRVRAGMDRRHQDDLVRQEDFDFKGQYLDMKGVRGKPKPYGGTRPLIMNAGASATGQAFAIKNCDAFFLQASRTSLDDTAAEGAQPRRTRRARKAARSAATRSASSPAGRRRRKPKSITTTAIVEHADWSAVDGILALKNISPQTVPMQEYI